MRPPINDAFPISQLFGDNPQSEAYVSDYPWNFGARISRHDGIDLAVGTGTPVYPVWNGVVHVYERSTGFGLHVMLEDDQGRMFLYAHLSHVDVPDGTRVQIHTPFAQTGSSGNSTGPHLHAGCYLPSGGTLDTANGFGGAMDWLSTLDHDAVWRLVPG
jgi:murein DD-endopeptidase MepM/ murein hydrolase activator NlpD